jgi:hypothetical protein
VFDKTGAATASLAASSALVVPNVGSTSIAAIIENRTNPLFITAIRVWSE